MIDHPDIDECKELANGRPNICTDGGTCQNSPESYRCDLRDQKESDDPHLCRYVNFSFVYHPRIY